MGRSYAESNRMLAEAKQWIPGGVTKARVQHVPGRYPVYMTHAKGSHVWDVDGNEYIDWMSGYGCILLGHACDEVDAAAIRQMKQGFNSFLSHPMQNELARALIDLIPCAERVSFFKSGTDVTTAAVRIARIHTGRDHVIRWGYHGWADWAVANFYGFDAGVPQATRDLTHAFEYNNLDSLESLFRQYPDQVACVIMMPFETELPQPGFLEGVQALCRKHGAVFILDEVRSGFHVAPGGAQEYFGVTPDLAAFSKAMANGYAIGAVVGKAEVMSAEEKGLFSATFFISTLEMAAALKTIEIVRRDGVIQRLWTVGERFQKELRQIVSGSPLKLRVTGIATMPFLSFELDDPARNQKAKTEFYAAAADGGVYFHPGHHWFVNFAHSDEDVTRTMDVCAAALKVAERAVCD